jgi:hypothetical protein
MAASAHARGDAPTDGEQGPRGDPLPRGTRAGLEQGDTIIKRRMVQKMEFLAEDLSALREPNREELKAWFEKNPQRFTIAGRAACGLA